MVLIAMRVHGATFGEMVRLLGLLALLVNIGACTVLLPTSDYSPESRNRVSIANRYGRPVLIRDGKRYELKDLVKLVGDDAAALKVAKRYRRNLSVWLNLGAAAGACTMVSMVLLESEGHDDDYRRGSLTGLATCIPVVVVSVFGWRSNQSNLYDAVNIYNDALRAREMDRMTRSE